MPFDMKTARKAESWAVTQHEQEMEPAQKRSIMKLACRALQRFLAFGLDEESSWN